MQKVKIGLDAEVNERFPKVLRIVVSLFQLVFNLFSVVVLMLFKGFPKGFRRVFNGFSGPEMGFQDLRYAGNGTFSYTGRS
jgi:hypothetical protein